jgi:hypothetical protein
MSCCNFSKLEQQFTIFRLCIHFFFGKTCIFFKFVDTVRFFVSPKTTSVELKLVLSRGRCIATRLFSLIISSIPATTVIPSFLVEKQMTGQMLVFQAQSKCSCSCYGKVHLLVLHCTVRVDEYQSQVTSCFVSECTCCFS